MGFKDNVPPPSKLSFSPLDDRPEHAAALGRLLGHWAYLELQLLIVLEKLLEIDTQKARFVYQEFISVASKIKLLQRLNHHFTSDITKKEKLEKLLANTDTLSIKRNNFIHAIWASTLNDDDPQLLRVRNSLPGKYENLYHKIEEFTPKDIQRVVDEISTLTLSLLEWTDSV